MDDGDIIEMYSLCEGQRQGILMLLALKMDFVNELKLFWADRWSQGKICFQLIILVKFEAVIVRQIYYMSKK